MKEREKSNERKSIMIGHHNQNEIHNKIKKIDENTNEFTNHANKYPKCLLIIPMVSLFET